MRFSQASCPQRVIARLPTTASNLCPAGGSAPRTHRRSGGWGISKSCSGHSLLSNSRISTPLETRLADESADISNVLFLTGSMHPVYPETVFYFTIHNKRRSSTILDSHYQSSYYGLTRVLASSLRRLPTKASCFSRAFVLYYSAHAGHTFYSGECGARSGG